MRGVRGGREEAASLGCQICRGSTCCSPPPTGAYYQDVRGLRESLQPELQHMDAEAFATLRREWAEAPRPAADGLRSVISKQVGWG